MPRGMIIQVFAAAGRDAENRRAVAPAGKEKPARKPTKTVITVKMPYSRAYTTYRPGARNMNANSKGSVTPQMNAHRAAEPTRPIATFFFVLFAVWIIASAAPGTPNIIQGKKPDMYIPRLQLTSALVSPAQKWDRSPRPMVSNQNTLFNA